MEWIHLNLVRSICLGASIALVASGLAARGQDAGDKEEELLKAKLQRVINERRRGADPTRELLNYWLFEGAAREQVRGRLESRLRSRVKLIDTVCKLSGPQREKLMVAGRIDIVRLFERIDRFKNRTDLADINVRQKRDDAFIEIEPIRRNIAESDCFGDGSLFAKVLKNTLSSEQFSLQEEAARNALMARHLATIRWVVGNLGMSLRLSEEQQVKLRELLAAKTRPPRRFGASDYQGLLIQASRLPETVLRPIFDGGQWLDLKRQIDNANELERTLRRQGYLPDYDVTAARSLARRASGPGRMKSGPYWRVSM